MKFKVENIVYAQQCYHGDQDKVRANVVLFQGVCMQIIARVFLNFKRVIHTATAAHDARMANHNVISISKENVVMV